MSRIANNYSDFVVYDIRPAFEKEPSDLIDCPFCSSLLTRSCLEQSYVVKISSLDKSLIPLHHGTHSFSCPNCCWYSVRERWSFYELENGSYDYLVTGVIRFWNIAELIGPLAIVTDYLRQSKLQANCLSLDPGLQELVIANTIDQYWPQSRVHYLGKGANDKMSYSLFLVQNTTLHFIIIRSLTLSGWQNLEVVEAINGFFPAIDSHQEIEITCARLINTKIKRRICHAEIDQEVFQFLYTSETRKQSTSWDRLSQLQSLYDNPRKLPESLKRSFVKVSNHSN